MDACVSNNRCFKCGARGHWAEQCLVGKGATVNEQLFNAGCCSNCGVPVKVEGLCQLHAGIGKHCTLPRLFLEVCFCYFV
jgi:hypothetical protein